MHDEPYLKISPMKVSKNKVVSIDFTLTNPQGEVLETSDGRSPMAYLHGAGAILPGLEAALEGRSVGESLTVRLAPENAYGHRDDKMVQPVPRDRFQGLAEIAPGMQLHATTPEGAPRIVTVVGVDDANVLIDANHPLAGMPLKYDVEILDVRDASAEELSHAHVHEQKKPAMRIARDDN